MPIKMIDMEIVDKMSALEMLRQGEITLTEYVEEHLSYEDFEGWENRHELVKYLSKFREEDEYPTIKEVANEMGCTRANIYNVVNRTNENLLKVGLCILRLGKPARLKLKIHEGEFDEDFSKREASKNVIYTNSYGIKCRIRELIDKLKDPCTKGLTKAELRVVSYEIGSLACNVSNEAAVRTCEHYRRYIRRLLASVPDYEAIPVEKIERIRSGSIG